MRLTDRQIQVVKDAVARCFEQDAVVWVFGSRVDDRRRGGDFDFYIETPLQDSDDIVAKKLDLLADLHATPEFEDEKIDIVVNSAISGEDLPIYDVARREGVRL